MIESAENMLGLSHSISRITHYLITSNGPAIWGGCVTRRKHRAESWYFSRETVTVQGGFGAVFGIQVQVMIEAGSVAVQC